MFVYGGKFSCCWRRTRSERGEPKWITEKAAEKGRRHGWRRVGRLFGHSCSWEWKDDDDDVVGWLVGSWVGVLVLRHPSSHPLRGAVMIRFLLHFSIIYPLTGRGIVTDDGHHRNNIIQYYCHHFHDRHCPGPTTTREGCKSNQANWLENSSLSYNTWRSGGMETAQNGLIGIGQVLKVSTDG